MNDQSRFLFVYGTLQPSFNNSFANYLQQYSHYVGKGTVTGQLVDIGRYPGAIYETNRSTLIHGTVVELISQQSLVFAYLDEYEGVGEKFAQPNEYARVIVPVHIDNQTLHCWMYEYKWPIDGCLLITSGDYSVYLSQLQQSAL